MPRKRELTWQKGSNGRVGRWRKKYRGKAYYFAGGTGKTDSAAYERALAQWKQKKAEIDAETRNPHEAEYRDAIAEWNAVLNWSTQHDDQKYAELARQKVKELQSRLASRTPMPLRHGDRLGDQFKTDPAYGAAFLEFLRGDSGTATASQDSGTLFTPDPAITDQFYLTPRKIEGRIWKDRVQSQLRLERESSITKDSRPRSKPRYQSRPSVQDVTLTLSFTSMPWWNSSAVTMPSLFLMNGS